MTPDASVIIPAFDQAERLAVTLAGFAAQSAPASTFELVIIDDGSRDDVAGTVAAARLSCGVRVLRLDHAGRSVARNRGLREATGRIAIFNDCDAVPCRDFIALHVRAHDQPDRVAVGSRHESITFWTPEMLDEGRDRIPPQGNSLELLPAATREGDAFRDRIAAARRGERVAFATADDIRRRPELLEALQIRGPNLAPPPFWDSALAWTRFVTRNVSVSRALLDRVGHFDESFVGWGYEDTELGYRLHLAGARYLNLAAAPNYHQYHERAGIPYADMRDNFARFLAKHPTIEVALHWRLMFTVLLGIQPLATALDDYLALVTETHRLAAQGSPLAADYLRLARTAAEHYTRLADPSPAAIRDSELGALFGR